MLSSWPMKATHAMDSSESMKRLRAKTIAPKSTLMFRLLHQTGILTGDLLCTLFTITGGAHLVPISTNMLNSVKIAHSRKVAVDKENAEAKRKAKEAAAGEQAAKKRKEEQEAEQRTWDEKKRRLEDNTREIQEEIMNENKSLMAAVSRGSRLKEPAVAQAALKTVEACQNCLWVAAAATKKLECKNHNIRAIVSPKSRT